MSNKNGKPADPREALLASLTATVNSASANGLLPDVPEFAESFPAVNALLTVTRLDGKDRIPATISFWVEDGGVKGVLNDRHAKRKLWGVAPSLLGLIGELEASLGSKEVPWRSDAGTRLKRS